MFRRSKIIIFGLAVLLIFTGVIYAQNQKQVEQQDDKFEIAQNMDNQNTEEQNDGKTTAKKAGKINFEKLMEIHPKTQDLFSQYQLEKEEINKGENVEENMMKLKEKYHQLVVEAAKVDLEEFAASQNIDLLLINDKVILGEKDEAQEISELQDFTAVFNDFLNK
jgi:hypothetical protein